MGTLSNSTKIGNKKDTLVLQTSGRVYINVGSRYYPLNFNENSTEDSDDEKSDTSSIIFADDDDLSSLIYPGDNILVITPSGIFYRTTNNTYSLIPINNLTQEYTEPLTITTDSSVPPFYINSNTLVNNLNAQYLNGYSSDNFALLSENAQISGQWQFNQIIANSITNSSKTGVLDFSTNSLTLDTITAKTITVEDLEVINTTDDSSSSLKLNKTQLLNYPLYIMSGATVISAEIYDKENAYYETKDGQIVTHNENVNVGGFSIIDLIVNAYDAGYLAEKVDETEVGISYYANLLTTSSKGSALTEEDFLEINGIYPYKTYDFAPVSREIYATIPYDEKYFCDVYIYDGWFNSATMADPTYRGVTYECELDTFLKAGLKVTSETSNGEIKGMIVGCSGLTARIILTGIDCLFLYDEGSSEYTSCIESAKELPVSAPVESGVALIPGETESTPQVPLNVIGDITGVNNSVYGELSGYGFSSEGNVYLVNSNIANSTLTNCTLVGTNIQNFSFEIPGETESTPHLKLDQTGFLFGPRRMVTGIYSTPWLQYTVNENTNHVYVGTDTYYFDSSGNARWGTIEMTSDGAMTIGKGATTIHIDANGVVRIPSACIV